MSFKLPGPEEILQAIGPTGGLPEALRLALDPGTDFEPIPPPKPEDWLAVHPEPGQTFEEFALGLQRNVPVRSGNLRLGNHPIRANQARDGSRKEQGCDSNFDVVIGLAGI